MNSGDQVALLLQGFNITEDMFSFPYVMFSCLEIQQLLA